MTPFQIMFSRRIISLVRIDHSDWMALFAISDDVIDQYYSENPPKEPYPVLDQFLEQIPNNGNNQEVAKQGSQQSGLWTYTKIANRTIRPSPKKG